MRVLKRYAHILDSSEWHNKQVSRHNVEKSTPPKGPKKTKLQ